MEEGAVVVVSGKLDLSRNDPQIICESITNKLETVLVDHGSNDPTPPPRYSRTFEDVEQFNGNGSNSGNGNGYSATAVEPPSLDELPLDAFEDDLPPPFMPENHEQPQQPRTLRLRFYRNGDEEHDRRRLKRLIGIITQEHGHDHFEIVIMTEGVPTHLMEFPNQTTRFNDKLLAELTQT